ncbi:gp6 domain containing protein [uncultured Caudovirales phage]|uniref:Gp6 domain containing protein n=1 Tax=uncultured Caudovirales phage TaxID=2100421 RepID=A0A6J5LLP8_9CAUD|nr:gp6 domain containing protein [uncultured Caudovirales phage]CAB4241993.1 gp6 domain containing protein [uncultured Caudovirales phage]
MSANSLVYGGMYLAPTRSPFNYEKVEQTARDLATEWLTLDEITNQLNLFGDESQDGYLQGLELAVRMHIEDYLGLPIFPQSYRVYYGLDALYGTPVTLDLPEVSQNGVTINSVQYWNNAQPSVLTTVASTEYYYDATGNKVVIASLPTEMNTERTNPIIVNYTVAASILAQYPVIKQAGLLLMTHLYNNRSETTMTALQRIPFGIDMLLRPYKPLVM